MLASDAAKFARGIETAASSAAELVNATKSIAELAEIFSSAEGQKLAGVLQSLRVPEPERDAIIDELCGKITCAKEAKVTLQLLAEERLIHLLPEISRQLEIIADATEGCVKVDCKTAFALDDQMRTRLVSALSKILGYKVDLVETVDSNLLAGITLRAGNRIWDGSVKGRLARLAVEVVKTN